MGSGVGGGLGGQMTRRLLSSMINQVGQAMTLEVQDPGKDPRMIWRDVTLLQQRFMPKALWLRGDESLLSAPTVAIIGSRDCSPEGIKRAQQLARDLAKAGVVVVSGLAKGIDTAAHKAAIDAGGRTIAVIGTGMDRAYPAENKALQELIATKHLLVSQFAEGSVVRQSNFPARNRTMALVAKCTVVIEAGDSSGTLSQAAETQRLGRKLFIAKSVLSTPGLSWPARFLQSGAVLLEDVRQVLESLDG